eukprot:6146633-Prymnesium_polylepis.1
MAGVCLQASHCQHTRAARAPTQKYGRNSASLDRVAQRSARAMSFDQHCILWPKPCVTNSRGKHALLSLPAGRRQARATTILPHRAAQHSDSTATKPASNRVHGLATCVPISTRVERVRAPLGRREAGDGVGAHCRWVENHIDARTQSRLALEVLQRAEARVVGDKRGRACRIGRRARALQPQHERDATARGRAQEARGRIHAAAGRRLQQYRPELAGPLADVHSDRSTQKCAPYHARVVQRCIPTVEEHPLLRIHRRCLSGRDAESAVLEELRAQQEATVLHTGSHLRCKALQVKRRLLQVPPRGWDHTHQVTSTLCRVL